MAVPEEPHHTPTRRARGGRPRAGLRLCGVAALAAVVLAGCTGNVNTPAEALQILGTTLPAPYLGEPYDQSIQAVGGLRPYEFRLAVGALPPGLELQGGAIRGTPGKIGTFTFTLQVSDANLSTTVRQYTLTVTKVPPPTLDFNAPLTQVDHTVTLRVQLVDARKLEGLRTQVRWNADAFELVKGSVTAARRGLALLHQESPGELQVALVPLGTQIDGQADVFTFQLRPVAGAAYLDLSGETEYVSAGGHAFDRIGGAAGPAGPAPAPSGAPPPPPGGAPLPGSPVGQSAPNGGSP